MTLKVDTLAKQMLGAALPILKEHARDADSFARTEFSKVALTIVSIQEQLASGQINPLQAELLLEMQRIASRTVLLALKGMALLTAEEAMNAALNVVKTAVNSAVGFALIA